MFPNTACLLRGPLKMTPFPFVAQSRAGISSYLVENCQSRVFVMDCVPSTPEIHMIKPLNVMVLGDGDFGRYLGHKSRVLMMEIVPL